MPASDYRRAEMERAIRQATPCAHLDDPCVLCKRAVATALDAADLYASALAVERRHHHGVPSISPVPDPPVQLGGPS